MNKEIILNAIKKGITGELDSITLYQKAYENSTEEVKTFFENRVQEEKRHYNYLLSFYQDISDNKELSDLSAELAKDHAISPIVSEEFSKRIAQNQILFSSISTALLLEKNAIDFYQKTAEETEIDALKNFYLELVKWEKQHYDDLLQIQQESEVLFWEINQFQPF